MNNEQIWQAALGEIELNLSKANFTTWFKNTFVSSFEDGKAILCVPNAFTKSWLETKYHKEIANALEHVVNQKIKEILYKVELKKISPGSALLEKIHLKKKKEAGEAGEIISSVNRFGLNPKYTFETFVVGRGNELAHAACQAVANNPGRVYNPLFIYGGVGLGKTHLLQAVGNELAKRTSKILYTTSENFINDYVNSIRSGKAKEFKDKYRNVDLLLIDDVQFMGGKDGSMQEFFHTFNELQQADKQIILTSDTPPKLIRALEARLASRFESGMVADIGQPDLETKVAILERKAREKNYLLDNDILHYVASNIKNNIRELEGALNKVVAYHEFNNTAPTLKTVKNILTDLIVSTQARSISPRDIMEAVCRFYNIDNKDLVGKGRKKELVWPRQISIYLMRKEINYSYPTIGQELGGRDHTTAMHAYNKILDEVESKENEKVIQEIASIRQLLYSAPL
ncbi:MAG TPA: chromosomal replication initiator protein DnaA [Candidatus Nanoarchaeia archaeon]|nr:chromosomal replication initiator protein DnaA [Candidatus Nanoarchaeia archaeon]